MRLIDDRGRLLGRLNLVDAAALIAVLLLVPLAYGGYLLFRPAAPRLLAVEPAQVNVGTQRVTIRGEHFRPALRMLVGRFGARFLLADTEHGVLELPPDLPPGTYDMVLLDEDQEMDRMAGALTVGPVVLSPAVTELIAVGTFTGLELTDAQTLWKTLQATGHDDSRAWNVVGIEPPEPNVNYLVPQMLPMADERWQVRAALAFTCVLRQNACVALQTGLREEAVIPLPLDREQRSPMFRIDRIHPAYTNVVYVALRSTLTAEELADARALIAAEGQRSIAAVVEPSLESVSVRGMSSVDEVVAVSRVRVPAVNTADGWRHRIGPLRTGEVLSVAEGSYQLRGRIIDIGPVHPLSLRRGSRDSAR